MPPDPNPTQAAATSDETAVTTHPHQRNAFTALMTPPPPPPTKKLPHPSTPASDPSRNTTHLGRDGLGAYITSPASFPSSRVIYHTAKWVVINDLFPKSSIHLLLLPRDPAKMLLHPFDAFEDVGFLEEVQGEVGKLRGLVGKEMQRRFGRFSKVDRERREALGDLGDPGDPGLPKGRDWGSSVISGIHAGPSMRHLHVHILSIDRNSECVRHRKHYNSFSTPFFVPLEDFPLGRDDPRRHPGREGYLKRDLVCWRCGKGFGNRFTRLKEHLGEEFEAWRRE